jgi:hypothetical protein
MRKYSLFCNTLLSLTLFVIVLPNCVFAQWNIPANGSSTSNSYLGTSAGDFTIGIGGNTMIGITGSSPSTISINPNRFMFLQNTGDKFLYSLSNNSAVHFKFASSYPLTDNVGTTIMSLRNNSVGIGTTSATDLLDVNGNLRVRGDMIFGNTGVNVIANLNGRFQPSPSPGDYKIVNGFSSKLYFSSVDGSLNYDTSPSGNASTISSSTKRLYIYNDGRVAIGAGAGSSSFQVPVGYLLGVKGKIICEEINVKAYSLGWPDYVFSKDYRLKSLSEIENYITHNHHLPNMPSAKELEVNGSIPLAELLTKQQEKIEELTLYLIEQDKNLKAIQQELKSLRVARGAK